MQNTKIQKLEWGKIKMMKTNINAKNLLTLLALKAVKARYLQKQYQVNTYDGVTEEYSKQAQNECQGEIWALESIAQAIDIEYYNERRKYYRGVMNHHQDSYKLTYITDMIEMYENHLKG